MSKPDDLFASRRRELIIAAASQCFSRTGFHGTSMADIIQESGLSAGQIYRYYTAKQCIVIASIRYVTEGWRKYLLAKLPAETTTINIVDINSSFWNGWQEDQRRLLIETYSEASRNNTVRDIVNSAEQQLFSDMDMIFSIKMPDISAQQRRQRIMLLLLITDGVICRRFTDDALNIDEVKRINGVFSHHLFSSDAGCQPD